MCGFLFAYWGVFDCFCGKVDAIDLKERQCFGLVNFIFRNGMASAFPLKQLLGVFWQIKNDTLTGDFGFVGNKMAFTIGKLTEIKSHFITYKSNANTYRFKHKVAKNSYRKRS